MPGERRVIPMGRIPTKAGDMAATTPLGPTVIPKDPMGGPLKPGTMGPHWDPYGILGASRRPPTQILLFFLVFSGFFNIEIDFPIKKSILRSKTNFEKFRFFYKKCNLLINRHLLRVMTFYSRFSQSQ